MGALYALAAVMLAGCVAAPAVDDRSLEAQLISLERDSWRAWRSQDRAFFESFLSDDHMDLGPNGPMNKRGVVNFVGSHACKVESYALDNFQVTRLSDASAVLVYRARQSTTCGGLAVPSPAWATSVFALRDGRWQNVLYQQLPSASSSP
ncbi:MAG TPA: nuclear transport factor 2 family protein [Usitatibacter sp.]|jgi:hypothetical protein|nr:nuclear transport factor 2 family protein [Usitatibacter sp.]